MFLANQLSRKHAKRLQVFFEMTKDGLHTKEIGPVTLFTNDADPLVDLVAPFGMSLGSVYLLIFRSHSILDHPTNHATPFAATSTVQHPDQDAQPRSGVLSLGNYLHVTVEAQRGFLYVHADEEPVARLTLLDPDHVSVSTIIRVGGSRHPSRVISPIWQASSSTNSGPILLPATIRQVLTVEGSTVRHPRWATPNKHS